MYIPTVVEVVACALNMSVGGGLSLGAAWYVGNVLPESKRTLINRLIAFQCLVATLLNLTSSSMLILTKTLGAAPESYCSGVILLSRAFTWSCLLSADAVVILRYVFTCRFKNVVACNDDLLYKVLTVLIGILPLYYASLLKFGGEEYSPSYYLCIGQMKDRKVGVVYPSLSVALISLLLHVIMAVKIFRHQRKVEDTSAIPNKESLITLRASIGVLAFVLCSYLGAVAAGRLASGATGGRAGDSWPTTYATFLFGAFIPGVYYAKSGDMAAKVWDMYREKVLLLGQK